MRSAPAKTYKLRAVRTRIEKGPNPEKIKLPVSAVTRAAIQRALTARKQVFSTVTVTVTDAAGNERKLTRRLQIKRR